MKERGKDTEQNFWEGHSFRDNCEWVSENLSIVDDIHEISSEGTRKFSEEDKALKRLKELFKKGEMTRTKRFAKGEVFNPKDVPLGTIIRLSVDYYNSKRPVFSHGKLMLGGQREESMDLYGVVLEQIIKGKHHDIIVCFKSQHVQKGWYPHDSNRLYFGEIQVGDVKHSRLLDGGFLGTKLQFLERVNYIEIIKYGTRYRARQPEPLIKRTTLLGLNPGVSV